MADQNSQHRSLSEISHLFLSSVRDRQTGGVPRPQRKPPQPRPEVKITDDLSPAEFQEVFAAPENGELPARVPPVKAILAAHLGPHYLDGAKRYARTMAAAGKRVGLLAIDVAEFRLITFEPGDGQGRQDGAESNGFDPRASRDAISELNCDLDQWLVVVGNVRVPEARRLMRQVGQWVALCSSGQESIISCYRLLKGLAEPPNPRLAVAALNVADPAGARQVLQKLSGVCRQFLDWTVEAEPAVGDVANVTECQVLCSRIAQNKAQLAAASHWQVVAELIEQARQAAAEAAFEPSPQENAALQQPAPPAAISTADPSQPTAEENAMEDCTVSIKPQPVVAEMTPVAKIMPRQTPVTEVIDLPEAGDNGAILTAVMKHSMTEMVECPLRPPMCPEARLAVSRDRRIVLIALAGQGLREMKSIGLAYRWVIENRALLAMAMPQLAMDAHQHPHLRLLVEQADVDADVLQPIFQVNTVSIHTYRRIRWGERTGLLLDAA